jgi:MFS family permease
MARFLDRIGKGIRGAPRDALIADLTPKEVRGAAFGLRQSLDTVGAFVGPLLAMLLMLAWSDDFRAVFWVAVIPAILSFALIAFAVREPPAIAAGKSGDVRFERALLRKLGHAFWAVTAIGSALTLARFSEAFLIMRSQDLGLEVAYAPLVLVGMNVVYSLTAYPVGKLADRMSPNALLFAGTGLLIAADAVLALASGMPSLAAGVALWGLHMGFTQGVLSAMVSHASPASLRGTAFGVFNLASGIAMLAASALAGALWQFVGPAATFWAGAALAGFSALLAWSTLEFRRTA